jgi:hypothetical protein
MHQIPQQPPYLRVKIWRRLQRIGAVAIKNAVYVLPCNEQSREDFQWLAKEILNGGGEATVLEARFLDGLSNEQIVGQFIAAREADYTQLIEEVHSLAAEATDKELATAREAEWVRLKQRQASLEAIDFFHAPGREVLASELAKLELRLKPLRRDAILLRDRQDYQGHVWVTRALIKYDRMASAWLIRRFIDPWATFKFAPGKGYQCQAGEHDFDMFEAEFTHVGELCTFEVLLRSFGLAEPALSALAEMIHDMDLKDDKFRRAETPGLELVLAGLASAVAEDEIRIARSKVLFDELFDQLCARLEPAGER